MSRLHIPVPMRFGDLDAYGHLNNVSMLRLLEEARVQAFWATEEPGTAAEGSGFAVLAAGPGSGTLSVIARQEIEYLAQVPYLRRPLDVQLWVSRLGGASLDVCYEVFSPRPSDETPVTDDAEPPTLYARAITTIVIVSAETSRPRRLTDAERAAWSPYLEEPVRLSDRGR